MNTCEWCEVLKKEFLEHKKNYDKFKSFVDEYVVERWVDLIYWIRYNKDLWLLWYEFERISLTESDTCKVIKLFLDNLRVPLSIDDIAKCLRDSQYQYRSTADIIIRIKNHPKFYFLHKYIVKKGRWTKATYTLALWWVVK
jgi:hypothetical protein